MSTWLFDLGNTRLKRARLEADGRPGEVMAAAHDGIDFAEGWQSVLPPSPETTWIASVGPRALREQLAEALSARGARVHFATTVPRFAGVTVAYANPSRLGVDRLLAMAAAHARDPAPALVVGVGTAITIDLVDGDGLHRGGRIAPSPALMRDALQRRAPHLRGASGNYVEFGDDTIPALASGCTGAALGLVERSVRQAQALLGAAPRLWLHGGGAVELQSHLEDATHASALVLEGLALWAGGVDRAAG